MKKRELRTVQHKETNDKSEVKKARELRAENQKLKRQISRMRRELAKPAPPTVIDEDFVEASKLDSSDIVTEKSACPQCGSNDMKVVVLGSRELIVCADCKYRKMK